MKYFNKKCNCYIKPNINHYTMINEGCEISDNLKYHIDNNIPISENIFRYGSEQYFNLINETRDLFNNNDIEISNYNKFILKSDIGICSIYEGNKIWLDFPYEDNIINEAEYKGKKVDLNKPKRGGSKKYYVYVKNDKGNVIKVSFGAKDGGGNLSVKIKDPEARRRFSQRHKCKDKKDKTKAGYWSCNLPRYAKLLGLSGGGNFYW